MRETTCSVDKSEKDRRGNESHFRDEKGASSSPRGFSPFRLAISLNSWRIFRLR